jgi:hypothetical protein
VCRLNTIMYHVSREIGLLAVSLLLCANVILPGSARGESISARPAALGVESRPIGRIVTLAGSVRVERTNPVVLQAKVSSDGGVGQTKVGDLVYKGDVVQTGSEGKIGITLADGTSFNVSSNARIVLDELVYDPNGKSNSILFSLSKGALNFIAGTVAKTGKVEIDTPLATMGIRGTSARVEISESGTIAFSTLIEEKNSSAGEKRGGIEENNRAVPTRQRQAKRLLSPGASTRQADSNLDMKLKICRGC